MTKHLCNTVWRARMERGQFGLRSLAHFAKHFRRRCLIKTNRIILGAADHAHRFKSAQNTEPRNVGGQFGLVKRHRYKRNCPKIVKLVRLHIFKCSHEACEVSQVSGNYFNFWKFVTQQLCTWVVLTLHHPVDLVSLGLQELCEVTPVLSSDTGDKGFAHNGLKSSSCSWSSIVGAR